MQIPEQSFNPYQLLPTLLQLAERRRQEEQEAPLKALQMQSIQATMAHQKALEAQIQAKTEQAANERSVQGGVLGAVADLNMMENMFPQAKQAEQDFGWSDSATEGQLPPVESTSTLSRADQMRKLIDEGKRDYRNTKQDIITRNLNYMGDFMTPEQKGNMLLGGIGGKGEFDKLLEQGKGIASLYTEKVGDDGIMYSVSKVPQITGQLGLPNIIQSDVIGGLTKKSEDEKRGATRYAFMEKLKQGQYDPKGFELALSSSKGPEEEVLVRNTAQWLIDNGQEQLNPGLVQKYKQMVEDEVRKGRTRHVTTVVDSLGRSKTAIVEVDDQGRSKTIYRDAGEGGIVTASMRNDAAKEMGPLAQTLQNLQEQKATLDPSTVGPGGFVSRYGGRFKAWLKPNYVPTAQELDSLKRAMLADQYSLKQARYETGAQRSDQEIARIKEAYHTGSYNYWEAKAALSLVEEGLEHAWKNLDRVVRQGELPERPPTKEFGSAIKNKRGAAIADKLELP